MILLFRDIRSMTRRCLVPLILVLTASHFLPARTAASESTARTITAVFHCDYPPVSFWDRKTDRAAGFFADSMDSIAKRAGIQVKYVCKSGWPELERAVETGEADVGVLLKSEEREKRLLFTTPIDTTYLSLFARSQSTLDSASPLEGQVVGVIRGSMSYEQLKDRPGLKLQILGNYHEGILSLLAGEIGLFAGEESMILKRARETRLEDRIKRVGNAFAERVRCLVVRKDNKVLLATLNTAITDFTGSPDYQHIYLKWYGPPLPYWTGKRIFTVGCVFLVVVVCGMAFWRYRSLAVLNSDLVQQMTERRKAERDLELFKNLVNKSREAIFVNDPSTGRFTDMNDQACIITGYSRAELLNMGVKDLETKFPDEFKWQDHVSEVRGKGFLLVEGVFRRKGGSRFPVETNVSFVKLGGSEYMIAAVRDITERKLSQSALQQREMQLAESQRIAHLGSWEHNPRTGYIYWSDELFRLLGLDPAKDPADFAVFFARIHPEDQPILKAAVERSLQEKKPFDVEYRFVIPGQPVRIIHARADLVPDANGELCVLRGTGQDITERKQAEGKIQESEAKYRELVEAATRSF